MVSNKKLWMDQNWAVRTGPEFEPAVEKDEIRAGVDEWMWLKAHNLHLR